MKLVSAEFDLKGTFPVPNQISRHQVDGTNLLIAPHIPAWIAANEAETDAILRMSRGATLEEAIVCLASWGIDNPTKKLSELLSKLAVDGFVEPDESATMDDSKTTLQIHVTNACNLRCKHCYVSSGLPFDSEAGLETWMKVIDVAQSRYEKVHVTISGGEPLLVPWLPDLLKHIKARGLRTSILSNGMLWTDKRISEIGRYVDLVNVSLDGATEEVHDAVRGKGSFRQAIRGISRLGAAQMEVGINVCLMRSNINDIEANLFNLIKSFPFKVSILLGKFVEEGRGLNCRSEVVSPEEMSRVLAKLAAQFLESGWQPTSTAKRSNCGFGKYYALYANGDVSPCLSPRYIAGNIVKEPIEEVFDRIMANAARANVDRLPLCRSCDVRYICGGKCHLPQVTNGIPIKQNACSAQYRSNFYSKLAARALRQDAVTIPLLSKIV